MTAASVPRGQRLDHEFSRHFRQDCADYNDTCSERAMKNILVLEDDPANLQIFAALLWLKGHNVLEATTADEALKAGDQDQRLDLFVSDVFIPGAISGVQVAVALAENREDLPLLFVSGSPPELWDRNDQEILRQFTPGSVTILEKPFRPADFEVAVERLLYLLPRATSQSPATGQFCKIYAK